MKEIVMKIFEIEEHEGGKTFRFILGMGIKNDTLRRFWIILTAPLMIAFNVTQVVVFGIPFFVLLMMKWLAQNNAGLWEMTIIRWNEPRQNDK